MIEQRYAGRVALVTGAGSGIGQAVALQLEISTLICWLGSDEAVNVNGAIMTSDGGWTT